ncbi:MAG: hypothetical protein A3F11_04100 [Gammaproteobacteria bacterium RIFCSPHIGHO2_12_FULL_37_14]|nr:MAG: hypothetical protein A3F11_04100 [Gammaproteobacteria bacterium RIFCSPHIGHO2_12_FULL_37_14]
MALLGIVLIFFQYHLWFESGGMRDMLQTKKMLNQQMAINEKLKKRNEELLSQIQRMQNGKDAAESRARNELGMIKSGETFYQIVPNEKIKG